MIVFRVFQPPRVDFRSSEGDAEGAEGSDNRLDHVSGPRPTAVPSGRVISRGQTSSLTLVMVLRCPMLTSAPSRTASSMCTRVQGSSR